MNSPAPNLSTGTTIMALDFVDGVVIGSDARYCDCKLTKIHHDKRIYCWHDRNLPDEELFVQRVAAALDSFEQCSNLSTTVLDAVSSCPTIGNSVNTEFIVAGYDKKHKSRVYTGNISIMAREPIAICGSGSKEIECFVWSRYDPGMGEKKAVKLVKRAFKRVIRFEGCSGGSVRIVVINNEGASHLMYNTETGATVTTDE